MCEEEKQGGSRHPERTKRAILDASVRMLELYGVGVSLAQVAAEAKISKSGMLHHYPNRDALMLAVADDSIRQFRDEVLRFLDLAENYPGKMLRAYVRALCGDSLVVMTAFSPSTYWNFFSHVPGADELNLADSQQWARDLAQDGLDSDTIAIVKHAAEGLAYARQYDPLVSEAVVRQCCSRLIELTLPGRSPFAAGDRQR